MPSFPPPGAVTICEINRDLVAADALSDDRAKDAYGDVLGMVFSPIPFQLEALLINREPPAADQAEPAAESAPAGRLASTVSEFFKRMIFPPLDPNLLEQFDTQKVSWNPHKHCLAFVSGKNQLTVNDFEDLDGKEPCILTSDHQADVKAVEWRPNSGKMIAVGCKGGICLWSASYPGNVPFVKSGVTSSFSTFPRGSGRQWILVDVLRGSSDELVSALCWKPDGRYLASASCNSPSFTIWDVSQGLGTPIRRGLSSISLVRWSPSGDYLLVAKLYSQFHFPFYISRYQYFQRFTKFIFYNDGTFHFWETNTWTSVPWSSSNGYVSGAKWDPEGCVVLLSFSNSTTLGSIHFSSKPPSLDAHLLPVELPEISSLIVREISM